GATSVSTTAEDAAALGKGVCQDYAHMMIALCRMDHIPARYVAGYLVGEGETHAWLEIYDGARWVGMDPTHNRMVGDQYISIIFGRDYNDCILDKGFFRSTQNKPVLQTQQVHVSVFDAVNHNSNSKDDNL
ncbi:MAG: transglutaminase family protein, partial [Butyricicoccaceae bacterium]